MGLFDGYENISPSGESGNPPPQGDHTITITRCEAPQNLRCGEAYIVHYTIDASTNPEAQIGGEYSNFQGFAHQPEAARAATRPEPSRSRARWGRSCARARRPRTRSPA